MVKKFLFFAIILFLFFNAGCWDAQEINERAILDTVGMGLNENKKIIFSSLFTQPLSPGESGNNQIKPILTISSDYSASLAARRVMLSLSRVPEFTHIRNLVLGDRLTQNNLALCIDFMTRNRNISPTTNLLISVGNHPEEILAQVNNTDKILQQLVIVNELQLGTCVPVTIGEFTYKLLTPGIEPAVPQIIIEEMPSEKTETTSGDKNKKTTDNNSKRIVIHGTAVFKGDKMPGSLNELESRGYRWLNSKTRTGGIVLLKSPLRPEENVVLETLRFSSQTRPLVYGNTIKMQITINARLAFNEETGTGKTVNSTMLRKYEQAANLEIARQINSCIRKSQSLNSDILGWGLLLLEYQPNTWKQIKGEWYEIFPDVEADVNVETNIIHTYLSK